jgi:tetratricopeptide (TPR) repeat protein
VPEPDHYHANLQRGSLLLGQNRPREALPFLQGAVAANPDAPEAYAELARCYNALPAERARTIPAINRAIALAPNSSRYFGLKGWYLVCQMSFHPALRAAQQGLSLDPTCPQSLNALANAYTKLGQWNAEAACRRILELNPYDPPGLNLLAQALRHQGRWKETRETVARLLANMPNNAFGQANAGYAALAAGDHLRANEHFRESLRMDPHFDLARRGLLQSLRARIWIIRTNMRIHAFLRRPITLLNVTVYIGCIMLFCGLVILCAALEGTLWGKVLGYVAACAFFGLLLYIYLSALVGLLGNFLLLFDPLGRHALNRDEKMKASLPAIAFFVIVLSLFIGKAWPLGVALIIFFALMAFTIQFPLLKDRWLRRREKQSAGES